MHAYFLDHSEANVMCTIIISHPSSLTYLLIHNKTADISVMSLMQPQWLPVCS